MSESAAAAQPSAAGAAHRTTELDSGVRIVTEHMGSVRSVALGLWVGQGSAHEAEPEAGLSHLLEHMVFRGTEGYGSLEIDQLFDTMGAELNAGTGQESTSVHARVLDEHLERAFDVMADMVWRPKLGEDDLDNEREIVLEELAMYEDEPQDKVLDVLGETVFGTHPLGRSPLGRPEVLRDIRASGLREFWAGRYAPANVVVSAAGSIDHDRLVELVAAAEAGARTAPDGGRGGAHLPWSGYERKVAFVDRTTEQTHVCLGGPGLARDDERRWALRLLDTILGGTSSSRLFQAVREERGLAYSVSSFQALFADAGEVGLYLGTRADNVPEALAIVGDELRRLAQDGITEDELSRARDHTAGAIVLGLESTSARMHRLGSTTLAGMPLLSVDELLERIGGVTAEDVRTLAAELYAPERLCVVGIGSDRAGFEAGVERLAVAA